MNFINTFWLFFHILTLKHSFLLRNEIFCDIIITMFTTENASCGKILSARNKTENFFYGKCYPVIFTLFTFLFWILNLQLVGLSLIVLASCFVFVVYDNYVPLIPLVLLAPMTLRTPLMFDTSIVPYLILLPIAVAFIFNLVKYPIKKPLFDGVFFSIVGVVAAFLLGGAFSPYLSEYFSDLSIFFISGIMPLVIHFLFTNRLNYKTEPEFNLKNYFCLCLLCAVTLSCFQLIYAKAHVALYGPVVFHFPTFCWANTNHIGNLILIALPLCCYLMRKAKNVIPYVINFLFLYVCVFLSKSDGSFFISLAFAPVLLFMTYKTAYKRNAEKLKLYFSIIVCAAVLFIGYMLLFHPIALYEFIKHSANDSGRTPIYISGIKAFVECPIFGVGLGQTSVIAAKTSGLLHSTFFHTIAAAGSVGLIAYVIYYYFRIKLLTLNDTAIGSFALVAFVMFALYALIDNGEFNVVLVYMSTVISTVGFINKKGSGKPLPLLTKKFKFDF